MMLKPNAAHTTRVEAVENLALVQHKKDSSWTHGINVLVIRIERQRVTAPPDDAENGPLVAGVRFHVLWATRVEYIKGFCVKQRLFFYLMRPTHHAARTSGDFWAGSPSRVLRSVGIREWRGGSGGEMGCT